MIRLIVASALLAAPALASAQAIKPAPEMRHFTAEEIAAVAMPDVVFAETAETAENYDKYFYFHRDETDFDTAFSDVSECDALASGISYYSGGNDMMTNYYAMQYGMAGVAGAAIASVFVDAIAGSAERRRLRRINLRNCMGFKGYSRFGLERERWQAFNFEEGNFEVDAKRRLDCLMKQARVASGPRPQTEVLPK